MPLELDNTQRRALRKILASAFSRRALERLASDFLSERYDNLVRGGGTLEDDAFDLIEACRQRGWLDRLVRGVIAERPESGAADLEAFRVELGLSSSAAGKPVLEKLVGKNRALFDVEAWRAKLAEQEWRVCQVRKDGAPAGTAFLIAKDAVLTNHHVMASAIAAASADNFSFVFDYRRTSRGDAVHPGTSVAPAKDWLAASSPHSAVDLETDPKSRAPREDELDFAIVELARPIGEEPPFGAKNGEPRGWIALTQEPYPFATRPGLAILQHPSGDPLKLALDPGALGALDPSGLRVRYDLPTLGGSSGSPVFDAETFRLVALHHAGDPAYAAKYNQGVPTSKIAAHPGAAALLAG